MTLPETERGFMQAILQLAQWHGYLCYHTFDSRRSAPGFVDLVLAKTGHPLLLIECKTATGRVTPHQALWQSVLQQVTSVHAEVWRPAQWDHAALLLSGKESQPC